MTTDLGLKDFAPHEIARLRLIVDGMKDWTQQQRFHTLIDAYEDLQEALNAVEAKDEALTKAADDLSDVLADQVDNPKKRSALERLAQLSEAMKTAAADLRCAAL